MKRGGKRILMLTHEFPPMRGGIARYASELATAAHALGHDVTVLAPNGNENCFGLDRRSPLRIIRFSGAAYSPRELPALLWRTARINTDRFDLIHAVDPSYVMALALVKRFRRIDYQATVFGTDILGIRTSLQATATGTRRMFEFPSRLVAISDFTKQLLLSRCPRVLPDRIDVSPLGVNPFWFEKPDIIDFAAKFRIPDNHQVILTVSRLDTRKGHRTVLSALGMLPDSVKRQLSYAIVGDSNDSHYKTELRVLAAKSGYNVFFLGNLTDNEIRALYSRASLFCMPGEDDPHKIEGFGLVYLEAAAQGLPSLASSAGAVPEVVLHRRTGWIVNPGQTSEVVAALTELLGDKKLLRSLGETARERASSYTWEHCARLTYGGAA